MKNVSFLSKSFFQRCADRGYKEILQKDDRPYFTFVIKIDGVTWGIPFRSSIKHPHAFWTDKPNRCGIDYTKAVIIEDKGDIDTSRTPHLRNNEYTQVRGHEYRIVQGFKRYIRAFTKACKSDHPRDRLLVSLSTLQNYKHELGIE